MSPKSGSMRYAHIFCGWSKRLKPSESRRAFIRSAWLCFVASTSRSHAPRALLDEAIDRSASGSETPVAVMGGSPPIFVLTFGSIGRQINAAARWQHVHVDFRFGSRSCVKTPMANLRVELPSRFCRCGSRLYWQLLSEEGN